MQKRVEPMQIVAGSGSQGLPFRQHLHPAVAQRLGDVAARDDRRAFEVRQGAGDAQYPVVATRREAQPLGRPGEQRAAGGVGARDFVQQCPVRLGIGADAALDGQPARTSMCRSMRSSNGPDSRPW